MTKILSKLLCPILLVAISPLALGQAERLSRVPPESIAIISIDVQAIRNQPELELLPWEIFSTASIEQLGVDATLIKSIELAIGIPMMEPDLGATVSVSKPVNITELNLPEIGPTQTAKNNMKYREIGRPTMRIVQADPQTIWVGSGPTLNKMITGTSGTSRALELAKEAKEPFVIVVAIDKIKPILLGGLRSDQAAQQIPPQFMKPLVQLIENAQVVRLTSTAGLQSAMKLDIVSADVQAAGKVETALEQLRDEGIALADQQLEVALRQPGTSAMMQTSIKAYGERLKQAIRKGVWKLEGDRVHAELASTSTATIGILTGLLLPAVQSAREAARRMQSSNNLKQLALAMHNYHDSHRAFPSRVRMSKDGKPLLSWRVALLPFIEHQALYDQFRLDEPWDSPHNKTLIEKMPGLFASPLAASKPGHSNYVMPHGAGLPGDQESLRIQNITDGTSNTIAIVEVNAEHAVPWTKPEDFDVDEMELIEAFAIATGTNTAFFDGSVHFLSRYIDETVLMALLTHAGGEPVNF